MKIKDILDELGADGSTLKKTAILTEHKDNKLLKEVLYLAESSKVKFFIKQIPEYTPRETESNISLEQGLDMLGVIRTRVATGHTAINHLTSILNALHKDDAIVIERIIEKDLKVGVGTSLINKVWPKFIEETPYQGAKPYSAKLIHKLLEEGTVRSDLKMDGRYCSVLIRDGVVEAESRQGEQTILTGALFLEEAKNFENCVLQGELTMGENINRYEANGIIASLIDIQSKRSIRTLQETTNKILAFEKKHMPFSEALNLVTFTVWDVITIDEYFEAYSKRTTEERFNQLKEYLLKYKPTRIQLVEHKYVNTFDGLIEHFNSILNRGLEGTIVKSLKSPWKDGKHNHCVKLKLEIDVDLKIVGFNYGTGKNSEVISSLNVESCDGKVFTRPTGINEATMKYITENQDKLMGTILEVKSCGLSKDSNGNYALLHPVFKKFRDDKFDANSLEEIIAIENMAKGLV